MSDTEKPSWEWRALADEMRAELDGAEHLLVQKDHALRTMREVNDYDTKYQLELEAQLATVTQERDVWKVKARWKHAHDDSLELELMRQLAASEARVKELEEATQHALLAKLETYHFECAAGPLELCTDWHDLKQQLATTTAHLEAQRTATFQAVAREHAAKKQLALARRA